jgi:hypothetical protein
MLAPLAYLPWRVGASVINGLTLSIVAVATFREKPGRWAYLAVVLATLNVPMALLLWNSQIDSLNLLGYLILPWGIPLLLIKPTLGIWVLLARRNWFIVGCILFALSLLIWGWWPANLIDLHVISDYVDSIYSPTPAAMGWYKLGWPIGVLGLFLMLFTNRKDPMQLMAAGSFLMPHIFPYHFVMLLPTLGRFTGAKQITLWLTSWTLALPFALWQQGAWLGYVFPLIVWYFIWQEAPAAETWLEYIGDSVQRFRVTTKAVQTSHS